MFSKPVILEIVNMFPGDHAGLDMYLIKYDLDDKIIFDAGDTSIKKKYVKIAKFLIKNQDLRDAYGDNIVFNIVQDRLRLNVLDGSWYSFDEEKQEFERYPHLYRQLRFDGFDIDFDKQKLIRSIPETIDSEKNEDFINTQLSEYKFGTTKGHLEQAKGSFNSGNYAALTGQLRTYTESLLMEMATYIKGVEPTNTNIASITPSSATTAMQILVKASKPILDTALKE